jgi:hypothetical protein
LVLLLVAQLAPELVSQLAPEWVPQQAGLRVQELADFASQSQVGQRFWELVVALVDPMEE